MFWGGALFVGRTKQAKTENAIGQQLFRGITDWPELFSRETRSKKPQALSPKPRKQRLTTEVPSIPIIGAAAAGRRCRGSGGRGSTWQEGANLHCKCFYISGPIVGPGVCFQVAGPGICFPAGPGICVQVAGLGTCFSIAGPARASTKPENNMGANLIVSRSAKKKF